METAMGELMLQVTWIYVKLLAVAALVYFVLQLFWGEYVLLSFNQLQGHGQSMLTGLADVWFIFVWAFLVTLIVTLIVGSRRRGPLEPGERFIVEAWASVHAGLFEEIIYRWLSFFSAMIVLPFLNLITFGFVKWLYVTILIPVTDFMTLHALSPELHSPLGWTVGAAIVSASWSFSREHKTRGIVGVVNSWFIGLVLFYVVFHYGIGTAIVAHILYDLVIDLTIFVLTKPWSSRRTRYYRRAVRGW